MRQVLALGLLVLGTALVGCSDLHSAPGGGGNGGGAGNSADFTISLAPASVTVPQGGFGETTLTVRPRNNFSGTISLSLAAGLDEVPRGLALSLDRVSVSGASPVSWTLRLQARPTTPTGTHRLKLRATSGNLTREADLVVEVAPPPPDFAVSLNPASLVVQRGGSGITQLTITPQNGFSGTVSLSLVDGSGNPVPGIALFPTSVGVTGSGPVTQDLTVGVDSSVTAGTYRLQVKATRGGLVRTAPLDLTVTEGAGTAVTVRQQGNGSSLVYYRVEGGGWHPLTLSGGQGTFTATGEYEVAARCDDSGTLHLFRVSTAYRDRVTFFCGPGPGTRDVSFTVTLPSDVGGVLPRSGDMVFVGPYSGTYNGTDPVTVRALGLKAEAGSAVITLHRPSFSPSGISTAPYGYKVVSLGAGDTSVAVGGDGWQAFASTRDLSASTPAGFDRAGAFVLHFSDAYLVPVLVGLAWPSSGGSVSSQYGLLPSGGARVGLYSATREGATTDTLLVIQDTGGDDWNPTPPAPWTSGQFSVGGGTLTFARTDARAFFAEFSGLARRTGGAPLKLKVFVQAASGGSTTYRIPTVPGLDYSLASDPSAVDFSLWAFIRDRGAEYADTPDLFLLAEAQVSGVDVVLAQRRGAYSGSDYTLP